MRITPLFFLAPAVLAQTAKIPDADWPMFNRDLAGTRYSPLGQITPRNVARSGQYPLAVQFKQPRRVHAVDANQRRVDLLCHDSASVPEAPPALLENRSFFPKDAGCGTLSVELESFEI